MLRLAQVNHSLPCSVLRMSLQDHLRNPRTTSPYSLPDQSCFAVQPSWQVGPAPALKAQATPKPVAASAPEAPKQASPAPVNPSPPPTPAPATVNKIDAPVQTVPEPASVMQAVKPPPVAAPVAAPAALAPKAATDASAGSSAAPAPAGEFVELRVLALACCEVSCDNDHLNTAGIFGPHLA